MKKRLFLTIYTILFFISIGYANIPKISYFFQAAGKEEKNAKRALDIIAENWTVSYTGMILDLARFMSPGNAPGPTSKIRKRLIHFLVKRTGENFGDDLSKWRKWLWKKGVTPHPDINYFKSKLYTVVDKKMSEFFRPGTRSLIRMDEIDWGGVKVNGIPPLYYPNMVAADEAGYINSNDVVFGIYYKGVARAYPKRILAWHEMALDNIGGSDVTIVYCTLCGSVIPYVSEVLGKTEKFGTSGLLYRSNKLMFDFSTKSLWSALSGEPVVGPLINKGIRLDEIPIVVTTWREWKNYHPDTKVLSVDTGFDRDYREGAAYRKYFSNDKLMFPVPDQKKVLDNKEDVLVFRVSTETEEIPIAVPVRLLKKNRIFHKQINNFRIVILTTKRGASRVYRAGEHLFVKFKSRRQLTDSQNRDWKVSENHLELIGSPQTQIPRIPAHHSFWFGWKAQFPNTVLLKGK